MAEKDVLIIYTGGTIGSKPKDTRDPTSPQIVVPGDEFMDSLPGLVDLGSEAEQSNELTGIQVDFWSLEDPKDSCNIGPLEWKLIATKIREEYHNYNGFVILHGTDTMVYTASALSFMLKYLGKPVVLTGAQRSHLFQARNDAEQNIVTAMMVASPKRFGLPVIPEVMIVFGQDLLRGNRARKRDANGYAAYETPKFPRLAKVGANIEVDEARIRRIPEQDFDVRLDLETRVVAFDVFPGITEGGFVQKLLEDPNLKGAVVRAYGAGNIPTEPKSFLEVFEAASDRNVFLLNVTQCTEGRVELGLYETSNKLLQLGMASGTDLTPESALVKLMVALGDEDLRNDPSALRAYMQTNQAGEQSTSIIEYPYDLGGLVGVTTERPSVRLSSSRSIGGSWDKANLESALLRLKKASIKVGKTKKGVELQKGLDLEIYANLSSSEEAPGPTSPKFVGAFNRGDTGDESTIVSFDVTQAIKRLMTPLSTAPLTIVLKSDKGTLEWDGAELALFIKE